MTRTPRSLFVSVTINEMRIVKNVGTKKYSDDGVVYAVILKTRTVTLACTRYTTIRDCVYYYYFF